MKKKYKQSSAKPKKNKKLGKTITLVLIGLSLIGFAGKYIRDQFVQKPAIYPISAIEARDAAQAVRDQAKLEAYTKQPKSYTAKDSNGDGKISDSEKINAVTKAIVDDLIIKSGATIVQNDKGVTVVTKKGDKDVVEVAKDPKADTLHNKIYTEDVVKKAKDQYEQVNKIIADQRAAGTKPQGNILPPDGPNPTTGGGVTCPTNAGFSVLVGSTMIGAGDEIYECTSTGWDGKDVKCTTEQVQNDTCEIKVTVKPIYAQKPGQANCYENGGSLVVGNGSVEDSGDGSGRRCDNGNMTDVKKIDGQWLSAEDQIKNCGEKEGTWTVANGVGSCTPKGANPPPSANDLLTAAREEWASVNGGMPRPDEKSCLEAIRGTSYLVCKHLPVGSGYYITTANGNFNACPMSGPGSNSAITYDDCSSIPGSVAAIAKANTENPNGNKMGGEPVLFANLEECRFGGSPNTNTTSLSNDYICNDYTGKTPAVTTDPTVPANSAEQTIVKETHAEAEAACEALKIQNGGGVCKEMGVENGDSVIKYVSPANPVNPVILPINIPDCNCDPGYKCQGTRNGYTCVYDPDSPVNAKPVVGSLKPGESCENGNNSSCASNDCRKTKNPSGKSGWYCLAESTFTNNILDPATGKIIKSKNEFVCSVDSDCASNYCGRDYILGLFEGGKTCRNNPFE